ncbi:unnamed protein product, partial [Anisakis simplex]|uniref:Uncharacterized protein n=1 Tax=Anisakis simplex TaxID=6269 RepID=A0A0M3J1P3_ANISI
MTTVMSVLLPLYVFCTFLYCTIETDSKNEESNFQDESVKQNNIQLGGSRGSTAARFRIPKKFDVKGTKLDSLKAMLDERARWLEINK